MTKIAYLVWDITDPHVHRRIALLQAGGAQVELIGFRRSDNPTPRTVRTIDLGWTKNGALGRRVFSVAKAILFSKGYRKDVIASDCVIARNLEVLAIALALVRGRRPRPRIIYESLDIHRTLSGDRWPHWIMRGIERMLLRRSDLLVTSSPRFVTEHFERSRPLPIPHMVIENKILALGEQPRQARSTADRAPWTIGWFGRLRCSKSLAMLREIVIGSGGAVEVLIAGRPQYNEMPNFDAIVSSTPGMRFAGGYTLDDLPALYGRTHLAWSIDYMEEGQNSAWLLPNRIYEAAAFGSIPIALADVETGAWLARQGAGMLVRDPVDDLLAILPGMDEPAYRALADALNAIPRGALIATPDDAAPLLAAVTGAGAVTGKAREEGGVAAHPVL